VTAAGLALGALLAIALIAQQAAELRAGAGHRASAWNLPVAVLAAPFIAVVGVRLWELAT
jgi:hypothetical protein